MDYIYSIVIVKLLCILIVGATALVLSSCSPGYVLQAAYEQSKILVARRQIDQVILDSETPEEEREKLRLVLAARSYAADEMGLTTGRSFTTYSDIGKSTLAWVLLAARRDSFALHTWWFPIVGEVPYKGFFDEQDARDEAAELEAVGYESWIRGTDAFSTLGWFNDPVLSTTLKSSPVRIANTVIHESVHSTVWIKGNVAFNESLAHFVGLTATERFFAERLAACLAKQGGDCAAQRELARLSVNDAALQYELSAAIEDLYQALEGLYGQKSLSFEEKIAQRVVVFSENTAALRAKYPQLQALQHVNNAEIMQLKIYLTELELFRELYEQGDKNWQHFIKRINEVRSQHQEDPAQDPFKLLRNMLIGGI